jgi:anti-sigma-K factor RskA
MTQANRHHGTIDRAGVYVLGTMTAGEWARFEQQLDSDYGLQAQVNGWNRRLAPMLDLIVPVTPPAKVWQHIQQRIKSRAWRQGYWNSLPFWRSLGMVVATLVLGLGLTMFGVRQDLGMERVMMIASNNSAQVEWVVGARGQGDMLYIRAVAPPELPHGKVCHLWMETADGMFKAVGILPHSGNKMMRAPAALQENNGFRVSVESANNLPQDGPSGPVIYSGRLIGI